MIRAKNFLKKKTTAAATRGLMRALLNGEALAREHPEILDRYREGQTLVQLAEIYVSDNQISKKVGMNSIYHCLRIFIQDGRTTQEELREIGRKHIRDNFDLTYEKTLGSLTPEQMRKGHEKMAITLGTHLYEGESRKSKYGFMDEKSFIIMLWESGKLSWREVASETNDVYGHNRSYQSIRTAYNATWRGEATC